VHNCYVEVLNLTGINGNLANSFASRNLKVANVRLLLFLDLLFDDSYIFCFKIIPVEWEWSGDDSARCTR
jgi:hypothetical protein